MPLSLQDAITLIERRMRTVSVAGQRTGNRANDFTSYGYDIYLPSLAANGLHMEYHSQEHKQAISVLMDAAWWYVGRGLLRPGIREAGLQSVDDGASYGFSVTILGKDWLKRESPPELPVTSPSLMNALLSGHRARFGEGFMRRATEAVNCYDVRQYLACCVMAGAAAEGVILTAAIAKSGNEEETLRTYLGRNGRRSVEQTLTGQAQAHIRDDFQSYMELLKFWRDNAAHGAITNIAEEEAYLAIVNLSRFARFVEQNWDVLTS